MMKRTLFVLILTIITAGAGFSRDGSPLEELTRRAEIIKPTAAELKWQRILWLTDLAEARRAALSEHRPFFLWVTGDDPLERC
jgi:hypothetical protein